MLDDIDLKILDMLSKDGRISHTTLGKAIGLTAPSVYARIQRLERDGIIQGYTTLLNPEKMGFEVTAFIQVRMQGPPDEEKRLEHFVLEEPQIIECHDVDGENTYFLKVRTSSTAALRQLIADLRRFSGVSRTVTTIALASIKEARTGAPLSIHTNGPPED